MIANEYLHAFAVPSSFASPIVAAKFRIPSEYTRHQVWPVLHAYSRAAAADLWDAVATLAFYLNGATVLSLTIRNGNSIGQGGGATGIMSSLLTGGSLPQIQLGEYSAGAAQTYATVSGFELAPFSADEVMITQEQVTVSAGMTFARGLRIWSFEE